MRNLTEVRLKLYMDHLTYLHDCADAVHRRGQRPPPAREPGKGTGLDVIASFPVMRASAKVFECLTRYNRFKKDGADVAQIAAAKQASETALVDLNVRMRDDLVLNTGNGRFPNAEVFRQRRGRRGA